MRLSRIDFFRSVHDPLTGAGVLTTITENLGGAHYDLFYEGGTFFCFRSDAMLFATNAGVGYARGEGVSKLSEKMALKYPKHAPESPNKT